MSEPLREDAAGEPAGPSDAALISRTREGDTGAYGVLYERHVASARSLARHLVQKDAEVDDVVAETFAKVLDLLRRGGGPESGFRPYLLTSVRRTAIDRFRADKRLTPTDEIELYDPGVPFVDPALEGLERSMVVRAFLSLPERWQAVLWHTEIEEEKPADVAPLLGLTANGVAALAYRAREGLREAYLQMHLAATPDQNCRPVLDKLGAYVRGGLAKRESAMVEQHLDSCADCKAIYAELVDVNGSLRTAVGPLFLGTVAAAYLATTKGGFALGGVIGWFRHLPKRQQQALGGGATAAAAAAAVLAGLLLVSNNTKPPAHRAARPAAAAPAPPVGPQPAKPAPVPAKPKPRTVPAPAVPVRPPAKKPPKSLGTHKKPAKPALPAHLTAAIAPVGTLLRDHGGILTMAVHNTGAGASKDLAAAVTLPPGVVYEGGASGRDSVMFAAAEPPGGGWACRPVDAVLRCTHAPLAASSATMAYLHVDVAPDASYGKPPRIALRSGGLEVNAAAGTGVVAAGLPARFAADGNLRTYAVGNSLLSCDVHAWGCAQARQRLGDRRDDDDWRMCPLNLDDDPATTSSSSASLPLHGQVVWAGLYWSGVVADADSDSDRHGPRRVGTPEVIKVRAPGATAYTTVAAAQVQDARLPSFSVYQAFADVTSLVRAHGAGQWWAADASTLTGPGHYAGWSLVVVTRDPTAPLRQAMVLDGAEPLGPSTPRFDVPIAGLLPVAAPATIHAVMWEGDADLSGDRLLLDGRSLTPSGGEHDPNNVFSSWSHGEIGPSLTFGTDVADFAATLGPKSTLSLVTSQDAYLVGAIAISSPKQS